MCELNKNYSGKVILMIPRIRIRTFGTLIQSNITEQHNDLYFYTAHNIKKILRKTVSLYFIKEEIIVVFS